MVLFIDLIVAIKQSYYTSLVTTSGRVGFWVATHRSSVVLSVDLNAKTTTSS